MSALRIGFAVPRRTGDPSQTAPPFGHRSALQYAHLAAQFEFDSLWVQDHFFYEWPSGVFEPYPEAWTLLTAIGATTQRVQIGTLVLAAAFRHPALLAKMAGALQEIAGGRLILGVGAGNQAAEHVAFGFNFDQRVGRLAEYLEILHGLLTNRRIMLRGRYYTLNDAMLVAQPPVPIWVAGTGPKLLDLVAHYASGWNWADGLSQDGAAFRAKLVELEQACQRYGRDVVEIEVSCSVNVLVTPDAAGTRALVDHIAAATGWTPEKVRDRYVVGTPDTVAHRLAEASTWGINHLICTLGGRPFTLWSGEMLELFASEVLPRVRATAT